MTPIEEHDGGQIIRRVRISAATWQQKDRHEIMENLRKDIEIANATAEKRDLK